jgi:hypothetical protein
MSEREPQEAVTKNEQVAVAIRREARCAGAFGVIKNLTRTAAQFCAGLVGIAEDDVGVIVHKSCNCGAASSIAHWLVESYPELFEPACSFKRGDTDSNACFVLLLVCASPDADRHDTVLLS